MIMMVRVKLAEVSSSSEGRKFLINWQRILMDKLIMDGGVLADIECMATLLDGQVNRGIWCRVQILKVS